MVCSFHLCVRHWGKIELANTLAPMLQAFFKEPPHRRLEKQLADQFRRQGAKPAEPECSERIYVDHVARWLRRTKRQIASIVRGVVCESRWTRLRTNVAVLCGAHTTCLHDHGHTVLRGRALGGVPWTEVASAYNLVFADTIAWVAASQAGWTFRKLETSSCGAYECTADAAPSQSVSLEVPRQTPSHSS